MGRCVFVLVLLAPVAPLNAGWLAGARDELTLRFTNSRPNPGG